jgi:hypothetical protein
MKKNNSNPKGKTNGGKPYKTRTSGGKGKYQPKGKDVEPKDNGDVNDSSFYYLDPTLRDQIMNFSMNSFNGLKERWDNIEATSWSNAQHYEFVNTNMIAIYVMPSVTPPLNPTAPTDGINLVGVRNYTILSANNAKTTNYQPQDVTMLMLALKALLETISNMTRAFGLLYLFNQRNRQWPEKFYELMYIDSDDFRKNAAAYRIRFNTIITAAQKIPFFSNFGAFAKAARMYSTVYVDSDSPMAQSYFFVPESTWLFDEAYDSNGSGLHTWMKYTSVQLFSQMLDDLQTMVDNLLTSTTLNYIYSDVLRLLNDGKGTPMTFALVPDMYQVQFAIDKELESYIQGMRFWGRPNDTTSAGFSDYNDVRCSVTSNSIDYDPRWAYPDSNFIANYANAYSHGYINFDTVNPSAEDKVNVTRLAGRSTWVHNPLSNKVESNHIAIGDYYVVQLKVVNVTDPGLGETPLLINGSVYAADVNNYAWAIKLATAWGKLRFQPKFTIVNNLGSNTLTSIAETGEFNYYTDLDYEFMRRMYDAEMIGEFSLRV